MARPLLWCTTMHAPDMGFSLAHWATSQCIGHLLHHRIISYGNASAVQRGRNAAHLFHVGGIPLETTLRMQMQSLIPSILLRRLEAVTWPERLRVQLLQGSQPLSAAARDALEALQVGISGYCCHIQSRQCVFQAGLQ